MVQHLSFGNENNIMRRLGKYILILSMLIIINELTAGEIRDKSNEVIATDFGKDIEIKSYKLLLDDKLIFDSEKFAMQRFMGEFVYYYEIISNNEIIGYAILDNVKGKVKPITYLVIFSPDYSVKSVHIIKYREQQGGAIENRAWLDQFNNKNIESNIELNESIDGISGATISVKAVTKGVKRLLKFITKINEYERDLFISVK